MILFTETNEELLFVQYHCVLHRLNMALKDGKKSATVKLLCSNIKDFLNHFAISTNRKEDIKQICKEQYAHRTFNEIVVY